MRYFAGFIGGLVVAVLLLVFQNELISGEQAPPHIPTTVITLGTAMKPKPLEHKTYQPEPPPEKPQITKPDTTVSKIEPTKVEPPRIPLKSMSTLSGPGTGPYLGPGDVFGGPADSAPVARVMIAPQYPHDQLRKGVEGEVEVEFTILPDGSVGDITILRADPPNVFNQQVRRAVMQWQFMPRRENGKAVSSRVRQVLEFRIPEE